jgi:hypothetical protein
VSKAGAKIVSLVKKVVSSLSLLTYSPSTGLLTLDPSSLPKLFNARLLPPVTGAVLQPVGNNP